MSAVSYALARLGKSLKDKQKQSIHAIYSGKDIFMILPTGFGKIICFEVLHFVLDHKLDLVAGHMRSCIIAVTPLLALMVDQVRDLKQACVQAVVISCSPRGGSIVKNLRSASVIFSSPEALAHTKWREPLENPLMSSRVCAIVDEAHCTSKW